MQSQFGYFPEWRQLMKITLTKSLTIAAITALALGTAPTAKADDKGCFNGTLKGAFVWTSTGFITAPPAFAGPFTEVGLQTFDGKGGTTATATASQNGNIVPLTITGTYSVNPDCTGTMALTASPINVTFSCVLRDRCRRQ